MDDRVTKLESDVAHVRADGARVEGEVRELRVEGKATNEQLADLRTEVRTGFANVQAQFAGVQGQFASVQTQFANLRTEMHAGFGSLRAEMKDEVTGLKLAMEKMRSSHRIGFVVLGVIQLLTASGVPQAIAHVMKLAVP